MSMQLALTWVHPNRYAIAWARLLGVTREVVGRLSLKEAAYRLDVAPAALAHALAERDRHYLRMDWVQPLGEMAAEVGLAMEFGSALVELAGLTVVSAKPLTAEERLARLEGALATMGIDEIVYSKAGLK